LKSCIENNVRQFERKPDVFTPAYEMDLESTLSLIDRGSEMESFRAPCGKIKFKRFEIK
jgi:hypothetical protein